MAKRKVKWNDGDIFYIELTDNSKVIGQVLDCRLPNTVRIALFDERFTEEIELDKVCQKQNLISLIEVTKEQLDYGVWIVIGNKDTAPVPLELYPNEQFRSNRYIGSITYDAALAEDFVEAFYKLGYWDDYYKPDYLDKFLISPSKKPKDLLLKKS